MNNRNVVLVPLKNIHRKPEHTIIPLKYLLPELDNINIINRSNILTLNIVADSLSPENLVRKVNISTGL